MDPLWRVNWQNSPGHFPLNRWCSGTVSLQGGKYDYYLLVPPFHATRYHLLLLLLLLGLLILSPEWADNGREREGSRGVWE